MRRLLYCGVVGFALSVAPTLDRSASAAAYDPALTWRTLSTRHFHITFHGGEEALADEVGHVAEEVWGEITAELWHEPKGKVEILLIDRTDSANGYATIIPYNTIVIYVTAPGADSTLSHYEDWNTTILTHEFTHIVHMDTVEGLPALLRHVLGRIISVNEVSPGWIIEGQAVFQETRQSGAGRGRSTLADMILRMAVLDNAFPPLGNLDGFQADPPGGNLRYLFGNSFQKFIADRAGEKVWTDWVHTYGGWLPFWLPAKRVFGKSFRAWYREWRNWMNDHYHEQAERVRARGLTDFKLLTDDVDQCSGPAYSPDGTHLAWSCHDPRTGSNVYLAQPDGSDPKVELHGRFAGDLAWRGDSKAFAFSHLHAVGLYNVYSDVYFHELGKKGVEPITKGDRASNPTFSADGRDLVVVTNALQQTQLARLGVDKRLQPLTHWDDRSQVASPTFSPDGRYLAVSLWRDGMRDIWIFGADGKPVRRVTADQAEDLDPAWSADGRTLYFSSDRTGIFNIYAVDLETERLWQVTNVLGGAFQPAPSPDGKALTFVSYNNSGSDIAWMPLDRSRWRDAGRLPLAFEAHTPLAEVVPDSVPASAEAQRSTGPSELSTPPAAANDGAPGGDAGGKPDRRNRAKERAPRGKAPRVGRSFAPIDDPLVEPGLGGLGSPTWALPWSVWPERRGDEPTSQPDPDLSADQDAPVPAERNYDFSFPVKRYAPWDTLAPRYVLPGIYGTSFGFLGVVGTGGADLLRRFAYSAYLSYETDSQYLGWGAALAINRWTPVLSIGAYTYTTPYGDIYAYPGPPAGGGAWIPSISSTNTRYWDKRLKAYGQMSWPIGQYGSVFGRWSGTLRQPLEPLTPETYRPVLPTRGFISTVGGGWRRARGHAYSYSISPEDAYLLTFVGQLSSPLIGSYTLDDNDQPQPFSQLQLSGEGRRYATVPFLPNHVIAGKVAAGASFGDSQRYGSYRLGGSFGESGYYTLPDEWRQLRGFPPAAVYGDWYYLGSLEYRMPLLRIDRGFGTLPFFARNLSGAAFVDAGNAFFSIPSDGIGDLLSGTLVGTGAELRASAVIGWGLPIRVRVGYGFAVRGSGGYALGDPAGAYAWLGTSF